MALPLPQRPEPEPERDRGFERAPRGWRLARGAPSLGEVYRSIPVTGTSWWRKLLAFAGPGYVVAVGYMDPGNWATSLAGGSAFGYTLLSVAVISSLLAILFQALAARLGIATGRDLAQACRDAYSRPTSIVLWILAELGITATDLAEVIGAAIAINLLFGVPIAWGVAITALDVLLVLLLQHRGFRTLEAFIIALIVVIASVFLFELVLARPDVGPMLAALVPSPEIVRDPRMLYIAVGILGATVMPHNLYLHSSIVQTRRYAQTRAGKQEAVRYAVLDSTIALLFALLINGAILVLAAATFYRAGRTGVAEIQDAYRLLTPLLGATGASALFAVALLAAGQNATITGTLAGQIVMEGFLGLRLRPWMRRLITRLLAIVPAIVIAFLYGERGTAQLLILSQVILSLQLSFAIFPLARFTSDRRKMGRFVNPLPLKVLAYTAAVGIAILNAWLLVRSVRAWMG